MYAVHILVCNLIILLSDSLSDSPPASLFVGSPLARMLAEQHATDISSADGLRDLLSWMLCVDPRQRPTILEILAHPWVRGNGEGSGRGGG